MQRKGQSNIKSFFHLPFTFVHFAVMHKKPPQRFKNTVHFFFFFSAFSFSSKYIQIYHYSWSTAWVSPPRTYTVVVPSAVFIHWWLTQESLFLLQLTSWRYIIYSPCSDFMPMFKIPFTEYQTKMILCKIIIIIIIKLFWDTEQTNMQKKNGFLYLTVRRYMWRLLHQFLLVKMWAFHDKLSAPVYFPSVTQRLEKLALKFDGMPFQGDFPLSGAVCTWIHFHADTFQPDNSSVLCSEIHLSNC